MKKLYLDEDVPEAIAVALRLRGYDVLTVKEAERKGFSDVEQLKYAFSKGRILLTHNIADFCKIHKIFMKSGEPHHGIILAKQLPIGLLVRALLLLLSELPDDHFSNNIIWLSDWMR